MDVLLPARALLHLSGGARASLAHGIRIGVDAAQLRRQGVALPPAGASSELGGVGTSSQGGRLYDWWGSLHQPVAREPSRLSLVFAFADPIPG